MNNQSFSKISILVISLILVLGGVLVWQYFKIPKDRVPEGWQSYENQKYGYKIFYPLDWETKETLQSPYTRMFAKELLEGPIPELQGMFVISSIFSKLPLDFYIQHNPYGEKLNPELAEKILIDEQPALKFSLSTEYGNYQAIYVKNDDYIFVILFGGDYEKEIYGRVLANMEFKEKEKLITEREIDTKDWEEYTDSSLDKNPFGYSVPGWFLSMKFPPNLEGGEGIFSILDKDTKESSGVELQVGIISGAKELISQYKNMAPGDVIEDTSFPLVIKIKNFNLNGCRGPQVFAEGIGALDIVGYQTLCLLGEDSGGIAVVFSLMADNKNAESLDQHKPLYEAILSTFHYEEIKWLNK